MTTTTYEYRIVKADNDASTTLNELGADGWRVVQVVPPKVRSSDHRAIGVIDKTIYADFLLEREVPVEEPAQPATTRVW